MASPILILTGPTAVGKTALSLELAAKLDAEIVSADSRQIYRELNIGTAKPTTAELAQVPHHFISEISISDPLSAGLYAGLANERISAVLNRGKRVVVVGGSTLYLQALQFGLADIPDIDPTVRKRITHRLDQEGGEALYAELQQLDPAIAGTMDSTKTHRLIRALEVYHGTGRPLSYFQENTPPPPHQFSTLVFTRDRETLYARINQRVDMMLAEGLVDEVRALLDAGVSVELPALRTIGYQEPLQYLEGQIDEVEMIRLIKRNSRRYAKRQLTWWRRFDSVSWLDVAVPDASELLDAWVARVFS